MHAYQISLYPFAFIPWHRFPFNLSFLHLGALSMCCQYICQKIHSGRHVIMSKGSNTLQTIPWRRAGALNSKCKHSKCSKYPAAFGCSWIWYRPVVSVSECSRGGTLGSIVQCRCTLEDCYFEAATVGLFDGIIITSSSKCAFHLSKADRMVFHNWGKIWKPDWQWVNLKIYMLQSFILWELSFQILIPYGQLLRNNFRFLELYT